MNDHEQEPGHTSDDADLAALLRAVGPRVQPPADVAAAVRTAAAAEWRATVAARQPARRRTVRPWMALAASVATMAIAVGIALPRWHAARGPVAAVTRITGMVEVRHSSTAAWQPLSVGAQVAVNDEVRTTATGRLALRRPDGLEMRLDAATQLAFDEADRASLATGGVYVDAGAPGTGRNSFVIGTPQGDVRHLGTQYVAAIADNLLRVAVREGSIAIDRGQLPVVARAGEALTIARDGAVSRSQLDVYGESWRWAESVAPEFTIDGRTLDEFLAWAGRETGRKIVYTSADAAREAEQTRLKGSVAGLAPEAAVAAVFAAEPGLVHQIAGGQIRVESAGR